MPKLSVNEDKRLEALRRYHANRPATTRNKLLDAIDRMVSGVTEVLTPGEYKWTKTNLALEAGVSVHTLLKKDVATQKFRYADVLEAFGSKKPPSKGSKKPADENEQKILELRNEICNLKKDKTNLACEVDRLKSGHIYRPASKLSRH